MLYDLIIIGTGPAGLAAALYAGRYKLKTLLIGAVLGGAMAEAWKIENYPGFKTIAGLDLAKKIKEQVKNLGVEILQDEVRKINIAKNPLERKNVINEKEKNFQVILNDGKKLESRALILALGTQRRKLNVPGEEEFHGRGVSYCATCDGMFFQNKTVAVIGGGDSAIKTALLMAQYAQKTYLLVRGNELSGEPMNIEKIKKGDAKQKSKIKIIYQAEVKEIRGDNKVQSVILNNGEEIKLDGVFIEIGMIPASVLIKDLKIDLDEKGYIKVDENQRTNIEFVYAAGDVCTGMGGFKQVLTAAAQGAVAATNAYKDLNK
jgi:thioredoxin reductase (NADPH)